MSLGELYKQKTNAWLDFECGSISEEELFATYFKDGRDFDGSALKSLITSSYEWLPGMEAVLGALDADGCDVHALSNYPSWYEEVEKEMRLSRFLKWSFVSCNMGVRKPDPQIFQAVAAALGVKAEECLLVDDSNANVEGARAVGMDAILFTGADDLVAELYDRMGGEGLGKLRS
mmetsp:Transcript_11086/g.35179  ORF Transcript_11086/g.35179 Transcript_11086/m.35179 type:complete len:175 (-) Transcript_11086:45-569(-)